MKDFEKQAKFFSEVYREHLLGMITHHQGEYSIDQFLQKRASTSNQENDFL